MLSTHLCYLTNVGGRIRSVAANKINRMSVEGDLLFDDYLTIRCPVLRDSFHAYYLSNLLWWSIVTPVSTLIESYE